MNQQGAGRLPEKPKREALLSLQWTPRVERASFWARWGEQWRRWNHTGIGLSFDRVRSMERPARAEVGNGRGSWCEYVPAAVGAEEAVVRYGADGYAIEVQPLASSGLDRWHRLHWHHRQDCDCDLCCRG
jgi:hypothetical protein